MRQVALRCLFLFYFSFFKKRELNIKIAKLGGSGARGVMSGEMTRVEVGEVGKYFRACQSSTC